jgi:hypothetical protein
MNEGEEITKGFTAGIFESKEIGNCSNWGISSRAKSVMIASPNECLHVFNINTEKDEIVVIKKRGDYVYAEPIDAPKGCGWMMGGSFIYSCDSRFRSEINEYPVPLHDRQESNKKYEELSR